MKHECPWCQHVHSADRCPRCRTKNTFHVTQPALEGQIARLEPPPKDDSLGRADDILSDREIRGGTDPNRRKKKKLIRVDDGKEFESISDAASDVGASPSAISIALRDRGGRYRGMQFKVVA